MTSLREFGAAVAAFAGNLSDVRLVPLMLGLSLQLANLLLRSAAWCVILRAAFPSAAVRLRTTVGAYLAGAAVNAIAPARGGDLVKVGAIRHAARETTIPGVAATLLVETLFDLVVAGSLAIWAYASGRLPALPQLPDSPAFEWSWIARNLQLASAIAMAVALLAVLAARRIGRRVVAFWSRVGVGFTILRTPGRYLRTVALLQAAGWCCRVGVAYELLVAFRIPATLSTALVVLVVGSLATMLPITPGGAGAQQALLVLALGHATATSRILAYSVGAQLSTTVLNATAGSIALLAMFGTLRLNLVRRRAAS